MVVLKFVVLKTQKLRGWGGGVLRISRAEGRMIKWGQKSKHQKPEGY